MRKINGTKNLSSDFSDFPIQGHMIHKNWQVGSSDCPTKSKSGWPGFSNQGFVGVIFSSISGAFTISLCHVLGNGRLLSLQLKVAKNDIFCFLDML